MCYISMQHLLYLNVRMQSFPADCFILMRSLLLLACHWFIEIDETNIHVTVTIQLSFLHSFVQD